MSYHLLRLGNPEQPFSQEHGGDIDEQVNDEPGGEPYGISQQYMDVIYRFPEEILVLGFL